ncbi:Ribosome assembly protein 1 [Halotydeus destructor]|nr:Ribosome assembly protein 1 [Halotydeus destructor]
MKLFTNEQIKEIQRSPSDVRNICILAHVDHGKTTLADSLLASNGIISKRLAGKLRYMDSRKDEQQRGITMKSSSISLGYVDGKNKRYVINLIDSPGHVDFCGEVSAAVRLCDGAMILVDVVEGVCPQTRTALRQAWIEGLKPVLVLNKIDRLVIEKQMSAFDAYLHIQQIVEQVNASMGELFSSDIYEQDEKANASRPEADPNSVIDETSEEYTYDWRCGMDDADDSKLYFAPETGNVIFASAVDGWGFTVRLFSRILSKKLGMSEEVLNKTLWGDYCIDSKRKKIIKGAQAKAKKPLFVQLVLENIWMVYEAVAVRRDKPMVEKIVKSLDLNIPLRDVNHTDYRVQLQAIFGQWLPLSSTILSVVCDLLPSPLKLSSDRVERLMCSNFKSFESLPSETRSLKEHFLKCSGDSDAVKIACISKMMCVNKSLLPENKFKILTPDEIAERRAAAKARLAESKSKPEMEIRETSSDIIPSSDHLSTDKAEDEKDEVFIAFARVFSGTLREGDELYVLGPKYDPSEASESKDEKIEVAKAVTDLDLKEHATKVKIGRVFIMMGRELEAIDEVPAGNVCGIEGLENYVLKSATLTSSLYCPPFVDLHVPAQPILRVAVEPQNPNEMAHLIRGLKMLNQADPNVQVMLQDTGEHVLITTGEVHLNKCIDDLTENFAKIKLNVSKPIVPFKETIVPPPPLPDSDDDEMEEKIQLLPEQANNDPLIHVYTPNKRSWLKLKAVPLPEEVTSFLETNVAFFRQIFSNSSSSAQKVPLKSDTLHAIETVKKKLEELFIDAGGFWAQDMVDKIWSLGPKYCGQNLLLNMTPDYDRESVWIQGNDVKPSPDVRTKFDNSFISGFQLATAAGPICEEPMSGVAFVVEEWNVPQEMDTSATDTYGPFSGQIMSTVKEACRRAFQAQPHRLKAAMYSCTIQVTSDVLAGE